ncbi:DUF6975 family protein [Sphingobium sp. CCH11-B1]|jgi:hypothetical protein|uniref:DUF6975 family protein n=1 Tax=Sphingobium sp. CCH11-B1 TaxID=1768781 RepID=UPI000831EC37|nr:hypothetical protein [Sphingobium sp. CCH11-B1]MEA3390918.1 hypothetical protein [Pseudomonadota bacterium]
MSEAAPRYQFGDIARVLEALVAADGTAAHAYANRAATGVSREALLSLADLADAAYYLCLLHGRHPGVVDHAATRSADNEARQWLIEAADGFARERAYLTQVTVAAGPAPSTAGQADCETVVSQQRHALDMLAQSDRRGCAMGAAMALVLDWRAVRHVLDMAAIRAGIEPQPCALPDRAETLAVARAIGGDDAIDRAIQFGARQLLNQHRGLWDLLAARADLRAKAG